MRAATLGGQEFHAVLRYAGVDGEPADRPVQWGPRGLRSEDLRALNPVPLQAKPRELTLTLGGTMQPYRWSINDQYFPKADPIKLARGEAVRFLLQNPTMMDHPVHLHGHSFHVLGQPGQLNTSDPPLKDTVNIPAKGALVLQWVAGNPGKWFFHCHIEWHLATGMARIIEIV
jgi:FtsP/CotA-like multicopper oxidase with cupredoxin domain